MNKFLLPLLIIPLISACVKNNPAPVWLEIDAWTLESNPTSAQSPGVLEHNFSDVWVYVDNKIIGVFEVPCKIPVLASGYKKIQLFPTIRNNGISATKKIYPFVEPFEVTMDLQEGQTIQISPKTRYYSNCEFWLEEFETNTTLISTDNSVSNATLDVGIYPGISLWNKCGHIGLTNADSLWAGLTPSFTDLPKQGAEVYLEINYYNTNSLLTGVYSYYQGSPTDHPNIALNAQSPSSVRWKKIYIDLREIISNTYNATSYNMYFRALKSIDNTPNTDVYIDNIKIVHF